MRFTGILTFMTIVALSNCQTPYIGLTKPPLGLKPEYLGQLSFKDSLPDVEMGGSIEVNSTIRVGQGPKPGILYMKETINAYENWQFEFEISYDLAQMADEALVGLGFLAESSFYLDCPSDGSNKVACLNTKTQPAGLWGSLLWLRPKKNIAFIYGQYTNGTNEPLSVDNIQGSIIGCSIDANSGKAYGVVNQFGKSATILLGSSNETLAQCWTNSDYSITGVPGVHISISATEKSPTTVIGFSFFNFAEPLTDQTTTPFLTDGTSTADLATVEASFEGGNFLPISIYVDENGLTADPRQALEALIPPLPNDKSIAPVTMQSFKRNCDHVSPRLLAPPNPNGEPLAILTALAIDRIVEFDDMNQKLTVLGAMLMFWNVTTCSNTSTNQYTNIRSLERITVLRPEDQVWQPNLWFTSNSDGDVAMTDGTKFSEELTTSIRKNFVQPANQPLLSFAQLRYGLFTSDCLLDIRNFPFDRQSCFFEFSLLQPETLVQFGQLLNFCPKDETTEWTFEYCKAKTGIDRLRGSYVSTARFEVSLSRKPFYYILNAMLPNLCLALLALGTFLLPPHQSDRPIFAVTILLALTVAMSDVVKNIPKTSQRPLLSDYILFLTYFTTLVTFYHMAAVFLGQIDGGMRFRKRAVKNGCCRGLRYLRLVDVLFFCLSLLMMILIHVYLLIVMQ